MALTSCHPGAKYLKRRFAENTARLLLRTSPAARQIVHCPACGYFHLVHELVAHVAPAPAGRPEAVPQKSEPNISERKIA